MKSLSLNMTLPEWKVEALNVLMKVVESHGPEALRHILLAAKNVAASEEEVDYIDGVISELP